MTSACNSIENVIQVSTFARLHFGFFDLSRSQSRAFGSVGVAIDAFKTHLKLYPSKQDAVGGEGCALDDWGMRLLMQQQEMQSLKEPLRVNVLQAIPRHHGLGSGTQMVLALGAGLQALHQRPIDPSTVAIHGGRGKRSGIGVATFQSGGLVVDGGVRDDGKLPPVLARYTFPPDWCFVLIMDHSDVGIHGDAEKKAFSTLAPMPVDFTRHIAYQWLMEGLPGLLEQDFDAFASAVGALQNYNAQYFSPAQGGLYASPSVTQVIEYLKCQGHQGLGQSSWGPTGFVMLPSEMAANLLIESLKLSFSALPLEFRVTHAVNQGASIDVC